MAAGNHNIILMCIWSDQKHEVGVRDISSACIAVWDLVTSPVTIAGRERDTLGAENLDTWLDAGNDAQKQRMFTCL